VSPFFYTCFMKTYIHLLLFALFFYACDEPTSKKKPPISATPSSEKAKVPFANKEAHDFFNWWLKNLGKPVNMNDQFRAKLFYKRDVAELLKYFEKNKLNKKVFSGIQDTIDGLSYRRFNSAQIKSNHVTWINQDRLRSCRKISKDAMWDCLESDYGISDYYYVSRPLFSSDFNWAVVSINYMEREGKNSHGANRLFKRKSMDAWEEVAILTYWGNFKE
jgi:hypothetical protein